MDIAVASNTRGPWFESRHGQNLLKQFIAVSLIILAIIKRVNTKIVFPFCYKKLFHRQNDGIFIAEVHALKEKIFWHRYGKILDKIQFN